MTKRNTQDDTIQMCLNPARPNLAPMLQVMDSREPSQSLLPIPLKRVRSILGTHCSRARVPAFTPHQLRHAGASHDGYCGMSSLEIQTRGRWGAPSSVLRYLKPGRYRRELERLTPLQTTTAATLAKTVVQDITAMLSPPPKRRRLM